MRQETNKVSHMIPPTYCLERVSRLWHGEGVVRNRSENSEIKLWSEECGQTKAVRIDDTEDPRGELFKERELGRTSEGPL